jgi:hypothetical protein
MSRTYGVVTGTVVSVDDPQKEGRVLVRFPWLPEKNQGYWAPVATLMAGGTRGSWFMPEKEDEVLVAFDHGDVNFPYVVGFLWNGADKPHKGDINASVRRLKTVSGHILEFDDNDRKERVLVHTQGENEIELKDTPASITIKTKGKQEVKLDDQSMRITIHTGNRDIVIDSTGISVSAPGGTLDVNCLKATVSATAEVDVKAPVANVTAASQINLTAPVANVTVAGVLNVTAPLANITGTVLTITAPITMFSGIVLTPALFSSAIVSPVYTPGLGNLLGL